MAYAPIEPSDLTPPVVANAAAAWTALVDNDPECYQQYTPQIVQSHVAVQTTSASYVEVLEWRVPENQDELDVRVNVWWSVSGGGGNEATIRVRLTDDAYSTYDEATVATASGAETASSVDITPSNSAGGSTPRQLRVELLTTGGTATIESVSCHLVGVAPGAGAKTSGYSIVHAGWYTADQPVPSEVAQRAQDNPKRIAEDRPVTLVSVLDDITATSARAAYHTDSATGAAMAAFRIPEDIGSRDYRLAIRVDRTGGSSHSVTVAVGMYQFTTTASGWTMSTQEMNGALFPNWLCTVVGAVQGGGDIFLRSLQLIREPD
jgi:hypothetical protein